MKHSLLTYSVLAGAIYFLAISLAHQLGTKIPMLFIYFSVPSHVYQDRIISFMAFGWSMLFFSVWSGLRKNHLFQMPFLLIAGCGAICGLTIIQLKTNFKALEATINPLFFWIEIGLLITYLGWLAGLYWHHKRLKRSSEA